MISKNAGEAHSRRLQDRLRRMSDEELTKFGKHVRVMAGVANPGFASTHE
jgi:hypothetical protein